MTNSKNTRAEKPDVVPVLAEVPGGSDTRGES